MTSIQKFYLHAAATTDTGTLPSSSAVVSPGEVGAVGVPPSLGNQSMDGTPGASQTSSSVNNGILGTSDMCMGRFLSAPLAAQTIPAGNWALGFAGSTGAASGTTSATLFVGVWRPSTGALVATILDVGAGSVSMPTNGETPYTFTSAGSSATVQDGDILVIEVYYQAGSAITGSSVFYFDGTTEVNSTSEASNINAPAALTMQTLGPFTYDDSGTVTGTAVVSAPLEALFQASQAGGLGSMYLGQFYPADQVAWPVSSGGTAYTDAATAIGVAAPTATEFHDYPAESATVTSIALVSATDTAQFIDAGTAAGVAIASASVEGKLWNDSATVSGVAVASATDTAQFIDSGSVAPVAVISATEFRDYPAEAATVASVAVVSATDTAQYVDASTETAIAVISATDFHDYPADAATVIGIAVPSGTDSVGHVYDDASTVTGVVIASATDTAQYVDVATTTSVVVVNAFDFHDYSPDSAGITGFAVPSATDTAQFLDAASAVGVALPLVTETAIFVDSGTASAAATPSAVEATDYLDSGSVVAAGAISASQAFSALDSGTSTGVAAPAATDTAAYVDAGTGTGTSVPSGIEGGTADAGTATGIAVPSATDIADYFDLASAVAQAVVLATDSYGTVDAQTVGATAIPSAIDLATFIDAGSAHGVAAPSAFEVPPGPRPTSTAIFDLRHGEYVLDEMAVSLGQFKLLARQEQVLLPVGGDYIPV